MLRFLFTVIAAGALVTALVSPATAFESNQPTEAAFDQDHPQAVNLPVSALFDDEHPVSENLPVSALFDDEHPVSENLPVSAVFDDEHPVSENLPVSAVFDDEHPGANYARLERVFDEDHPETENPPVSTVFDDEHPGANYARRERVFDEDHPNAREGGPSTALAPESRGAVAFPNPSFGAVTVESGSTSLQVEVYDVTGRRVASFAGNAGRADWDGRDRSGRLVPAGVYFARVNGEAGAAQTVRLVRK